MPPPGDPPTFSTKVPPTLLTARRVHPAGLAAQTGCAGGRAPGFYLPGSARASLGGELGESPIYGTPGPGVSWGDPRLPTPPPVFPTVRWHRTVGKPPWKLLRRKQSHAVLPGRNPEVAGAAGDGRVLGTSRPQRMASKVDVGEAYDFWLRGRVWGTWAQSGIACEMFSEWDRTQEHDWGTSGASGVRDSQSDSSLPADRLWGLPSSPPLGHAWSRARA